MTDQEVNAGRGSSGFSHAIEAKIKLSLAEAEMENLDVKFISLVEHDGLISNALKQWVKQSSSRHTGKLSAYIQDPRKRNGLDDHPAFFIGILDESIKIRYFSEILVVGTNVAIYDADGKIYIQRGKEFIDSANKIARSLSKITLLIEAKKK